MGTRPERNLLSATARGAESSAIRDLLEHAQRPGMISLAGGIPDPALFPRRRLASIATRAIEEPSGRYLQYGLTAGQLETRELLARLYGDVEIDQVLVTTGSQQGLDLLARVLLDPGDVVVTAAAEYLGALQAFRSRDAHLVPVPCDDDGLRVDVLDDLLASGVRPKIVYTVPSFHNPTTGCLSLLRRARLHQLAVRHQFVVVEDDPYRDLTYGPSPSTPAAPPDYVVNLGSASKTLAAGLRVGWMIGPKWLLAAVETMKQACDLHTGTLAQSLVAGALGAPWFPDHIDRVRDRYRAKSAVLCDELATQLDSSVEFAAPQGGMFVWARFDGVDTTELLTAALDRGVAFVPGAAFEVDSGLRSHARLSFATVEPSEITEAVARLGRSLDAIRGRSAAMV